MSSEVSNLMKRCQRGVGGRNALDEAHNIMAECYGMLGRLEAERDAARAQLAAIQGVMGEVVELKRPGAWKLFSKHYREGFNEAEAQHQRITAAMAAELEQLRKDAGAEMFLTLSGELAQVRGELEAARKQEPAHWWRDGVDGVEYCQKPFTNDWHPLYALPPLAGKVAVPDVLFDGHAVYTESCRLRAIKGGNARTSPENVSDTLDAVVSLLRGQQAEVKHDA